MATVAIDKRAAPKGGRLGGWWFYWTISWTVVLRVRAPALPVRVKVKVPVGVPFFPFVVLTLTVADDALVPLRVTEDGAIVHVAPLGEPEQLSATAQVNPPRGVRLSP